MQTITVTNQTELESAIATAVAGEGVTVIVSGIIAISSTVLVNGVADRITFRNPFGATGGFSFSAMTPVDPDGSTPVNNGFALTNCGTVEFIGLSFSTFDAGGMCIKGQSGNGQILIDGCTFSSIGAGIFAGWGAYVIGDTWQGGQVAGGQGDWVVTHNRFTNCCTGNNWNNVLYPGGVGESLFALRNKFINCGPIIAAPQAGYLRFDKNMVIGGCTIWDESLAATRPVAPAWLSTAAPFGSVSRNFFAGTFYWISIAINDQDRIDFRANDYRLATWSSGTVCGNLGGSSKTAAQWQSAGYDTVAGGARWP